MGREGRRVQNFSCLLLGLRETKGSFGVSQCALVPFCSSFLPV